MTDPRWLKEHRRRQAERDRYPLRLVIPDDMPPPHFSPGTLWSTEPGPVRVSGRTRPNPLKTTRRGY